MYTFSATILASLHPAFAAGAFFGADCLTLLFLSSCCICDSVDALTRHLICDSDDIVRTFHFELLCASLIRSRSAASCSKICSFPSRSRPAG